MIGSDHERLARGLRSRCEWRESSDRVDREAGDTLIEVLVALVVISLTVVSILAAFATTIAATAEHRSLATSDSIMRSFIETTTYDISLSTTPDFVACATQAYYQNSPSNNTGNNTSIVSSYNSGLSSSGHYTDYSVSLSVTAYEGTGCQSSPSQSAPSPLPSNPPPQELTANVLFNGTSVDSLSFVVEPPQVNSTQSISPNPAAANASVTITGTGFKGATAVDFGTGNPASTFSVNTEGTSITATVPPEPAGNGTVTVTVSTPTSGTSESAGTFTYISVTGVSPSPAPAGDNSEVITGTGFAIGDTVNFGALSASTVTVNSATQITVTVPGSGTTPPTSGTVAVTVSATGAGTSATSSSDQFTYLAVTGVSPSPAPAGDTSVKIAGTGFATGDTVKFGTLSVSTLTVNSATQITVTVPGSGTTPPTSGTVDVTVTNTTGSSATSSSDQFTYLAVTGVSPSPAPAGDTSVAISGTGFATGDTVKFGTLSVSTLTVNSPTQITVTVPGSGTTPPTSGTVDVTVSATGAGTSATSSSDQFTYLAVTGVSPSPAPAGDTSVKITGTGFATGDTVKFGPLSVGTLTVNSATQITVTVPGSGTTPPTSGTVDVTVTIPGTGTSATSSSDQFTYLAVTGVNPHTGLSHTATTANVVITGTGFATGDTVKFGNNSATNVVVNSATQITCTAPTQSNSGTVAVRVTNANGTSATSSSDQVTYS